MLGGALGYDLTADPYFTPLWGAVGDVQVYAAVEADAAMAFGLFTGSTAACVGALAPPQPPAPPGGYSPPPPHPPLAPREVLGSESLALCVPGLTAVETQSYEHELVEGVATYLALVRAKVRISYIVTGCNNASASAPAGRRRLQQSNATVLGNVTLANSTAGFALDDVPASTVAAKLLPLYNASTAGTALAVLSASVNAALASSGLPPLQAVVQMVGALVSTPVAPPPPRSPPHPPGTTPASLLAATNAGKKDGRGPRLRGLEDTGTAVAYAIAALVVLWAPVHAAVHAAQAAYLRRTAVTAALVVRLDNAPEEDKLRGAALAAAAEEEAHAEGEEKELIGRRFGAPKLAAALIDILAREAAAAASVDVQPPPRRTALRPLLRTPLVTALGPKAARSSTSQRLAARKKPNNLFWRFKRWLASELHWQARELRHALRALRRCFGRSKDPVGKAFRVVPAPGGGTAVLVEVTWRFGWKGRGSASCWRRRLRDASQLAALEAALTTWLAGTAVDVAVQQPGADAAAVVVALLDDEPHANLDKKRKTNKDDVGVADAAAPVVGGDIRSAGVAPAVAERLEAVLALCDKRRSAEELAAAAVPEPPSNV